MTPLTPILAAEIRELGSISFSRFMEAALYHPEHGYYRGTNDPFGKEGDFFTAAQMQPVFGRLIAQAIEGVRDELGAPAEFEVLEVGAGRGEMEPALRHMGYRGIDVGRGCWPERLTGVLFANELFDALPVDVGYRAEGKWREARVAWDGERFTWDTERALPAADLEYLAANALDNTEWMELPRAALAMIRRLSETLVHGCVCLIDYGFTRREVVRFPRGSLLAYRRHAAYEDVLTGPGTRDITAHVPFDALLDHARACGLELVRFETLQQMLLRTGERDQFARALEAGSEKEALALRMQLKTLLFSMGETFRVAWLRR